MGIGNKHVKKGVAFALAAAMVFTSVPVEAAVSPSLTKASAVIYVNGKGSNKSVTLQTKNSRGYKVTYASSNQSVALVTSKGVVSAKKAGQATVTATFKKADKTVKRTAKISVKTAAKSVEITNKDKFKEIVPIGSKEKILTKSTPTKNNDTITFSSSDSKIATVDASGNVAGISSGSAIITAVAKYSGKKDTVTVTSVDTSIKAKQSGYKSFKIESGISLKDKEIKVLKSNTPITVTPVYSKDGKSIELTTVSKLTAGSYTITVGDKTAVVKGEVSVATKIEIDKRFKLNAAALSDTVNGGTVSYKVLDQFGGDLTSQVSVNVFTSLGTASVSQRTGRITVLDGTGGNSVFRNYELGNPITITVMIEGGLSESIQCEMSNMSVADEVSVAGIFSTSGKELTDSFNGEDDSFYIMFDVKDQYGEVYSDMNDDITKQVMNTLSVEVVGGITSITAENNGNMKIENRNKVFTTVTKDGQDYIALKLGVEDGKKARKGTVIIRMFGTSSLKLTSETFEVVYGTTVDSFTAVPIDTVALGEDIEFTYQALDVKGNPVTDINSLNELVRNEDRTLTDFGYDFKFVQEGDQVKLYRKSNAALNPNVGYIYSPVLTKTGKASIVSYKLMAKARPTAIVAYNGVSRNALNYNSVTFETKNFVFLDQYNREMKLDDVYDFENEYAIMVEADSNDFAIPGNGTIALKSSGKIAVKPNFINTTNPLSFSLVAANTGVEIKDDVYKKYEANAQFDVLNKLFTRNSVYDSNMTAVKFSALQKFEIDTVPLLYAGATNGNAYGYDFKVYGIYNDKKIEIPKDSEYYSVVMPTGSSIDSTDGKGNPGLAYDEGNGKLYSIFNYGKENEAGESSDDFIVGRDPVKELKREIRIVINNREVDIFDQMITISKEDPKVTKLSLKYPEDYVETGKQNRTLNGQLKIAMNDLTNNPGENVLRSCMVVTDQYGASSNNSNKLTELKINELEPRYYITNIKAATGSKDTRIIKGNGTSNPTFQGFKAGDTLTIKYSFGIGINATMDVEVY